jgi:hypothetical protein
LFDRYPGQFAVSLRGLATAGIKQAASGVHRKAKNRARRQQFTPLSESGPQWFSLFLSFWKTNENSHPRPEKASNGINAAAIN